MPLPIKNLSGITEIQLQKLCDGEPVTTNVITYEKSTDQGESLWLNEILQTEFQVTGLLMHPDGQFSATLKPLDEMETFDFVIVWFYRENLGG